MKAQELFIVGVLIIIGCFVCSEAGPTELSASDRGLTKTDVTASLLLQEGSNYYRGVAKRSFKGNVLGYVTPWNNHGYDVARIWRAKFTHISPVWYQLRADPKGGPEIQLTGGHDVDQAWIARLREPITKEVDCADGDSVSQTCAAHLQDDWTPPRIVPRVVPEVSGDDLINLLSTPVPVVSRLVTECEEQNYDGLVFDGWLEWSPYLASDDYNAKLAVLGFIAMLSVRLKEMGKELIVTVPPVVPSTPGGPHTNVDHMQQIANLIPSYQLMTYDYTRSGPGPNGPLFWQEENMKAVMEAEVDPDEDDGSGTMQVNATQLFMGINFYGYDYSKPDTAKNSYVKSRAVLGEEFMVALRRAKPKLVWEAANAEHKIKYKEGGVRHTVYFPTPASVKARVDLAAKLGVGLAIWELGQGLDVFMDLL